MINCFRNIFEFVYYNIRQGFVCVFVERKSRVVFVVPSHDHLRLFVFVAVVAVVVPFINTTTRSIYPRPWPFLSSSSSSLVFFVCLYFPFILPMHHDDKCSRGGGVAAASVLINC